ncbi:hypothetical protein C4817_23785 [Salmonella enterica subsp. enterica serovar Newport]|uniref:hypothetical protein n=1 Tax=Salmonella enterica TaxID=28901 RepID=UPI000D57765D|nr:hypothetical protein [Salmonella enterica]EJJ3832481.1 hypothetical protein [Salmonella enterica subsp. enterica serovar Muenchen]EKF1791631.1 hypothetical protein [Salmonella enterica subsp. enterica serovar Muenchen]PVK80384.1 hypothetical protein C4817_23785 [Salmonella enterica subsp. enterica serovar Newport]
MLNIKGDIFKDGVLFTGYFMLMKCSAETCAAFGIVKNPNKAFYLSEEFCAVFMALAPAAIKMERGNPCSALVWNQQQSFINAINEGYITPVDCGFVLSVKAINEMRQRFFRMNANEINMYADALTRFAAIHDREKEELNNAAI